MLFDINHCCVCLFFFFIIFFRFLIDFIKFKQKTVHFNWCECERKLIHFKYEICFRENVAQITFTSIQLSSHQIIWFICIQIEFFSGNSDNSYLKFARNTPPINPIRFNWTYMVCLWKRGRHVKCREIWRICFVCIVLILGYIFWINLYSSLGDKWNVHTSQSKAKIFSFNQIVFDVMRNVSFFFISCYFYEFIQ